MNIQTYLCICNRLFLSECLADIFAISSAGIRLLEQAWHLDDIWRALLSQGRIGPSVKF